jgi:hypothetical protein
MTSLHTSQPQQIFTGHHTSRRLFLVFGIIFCLLAAALLCVPYEDWSSRAAGFLLLVLPVGSFGLYFLRAGWLLQQARVVVSEAGIELNIPNFKEGWIFRSVPVQLCWEEICCVQHEKQPLIAGGKAIDHYWIHSTHGMFLLTPALCRDAAEVVRLIAERKGCALTEAAPKAVPPPIAPEQEEAQLKRQAVAVVVILFLLVGGIVLAVTAETPVGQMVLAGMRGVSQLLNLFFLVATVASILGLWWSARQERLRLNQQTLVEKM